MISPENTFDVREMLNESLSHLYTKCDEVFIGGGSDGVDSKNLVLIDTEKYRTQKNILYGKHDYTPNGYVRMLVTSVLKQYIEENIKFKLDNNSTTKRFEMLYNSNPDFTYEDIQREFGKDEMDENGLPLMMGGNGTLSHSLHSFAHDSSRHSSASARASAPSRISSHTSSPTHASAPLPEQSIAPLSESLTTSSADTVCMNEVNPTNAQQQPISISCVICYGMVAFAHHDLELLIKTHNVFCYPLPLSGRKAWLDNWSLNGPANALDFIFREEFDCDEVVSVQTKHSHHNDSQVKLPGYTHGFFTQSFIKEHFGVIGVLKFVGIFRAFLICNKLLPTTNELCKDISAASDIWEECVKYFPVYFIGSCTCDWYDDSRAPSPAAIAEFVDHFPDTYVISIVNVSSSESNDGGSHWMGLFFMNDDGAKSAKLLCPQGSTWKVFQDPRLNNEVKDAGFAREHNMVSVQQDDCNCGVYSLLLLYMSIMTKGNINEAVAMIGTDAKNIHGKNNKWKSIEEIKHTLFGWD